MPPRSNRCDAITMRISSGDWIKFLIAMFVPMVTVATFIITMRNDIDNNTDDIAKQGTKLEAHDGMLIDAAKTLARLEERTAKD